MPDGAARRDITPASSTAALRQSNIATVARLLFLDGPLTRGALVERTGLARPTVQAVVQDLLADGTVREQPAPDAGGPGRPATALSFDERQASVVACRRRDDRVDVVLADLRGAVLAATTVTPTPPLPELGSAVADAAARLAASASVAAPLGPVGAVAVCVPGVIDRASGRTTVTDPTNGWRDEPVPALLEAALGVPAQILTPAAAALEGIGWEHRRAMARDGGRSGFDARAALLVFLDHGIAASARVERVAAFGAGGDGGEIGHHVVVVDGDPCPCGRRGCLETVAAGWAVLRAVSRLRPEVDLDGGPTTLAALEALGRPDVDAVLTSAATALGVHVSMLVTAMEPRWVLLGGTDFAAGATRFLAAFREAVESRRARVAGRETGYVLAPADADLVGAVRAALDALPDRLRSAVDA